MEKNRTTALKMLPAIIPALLLVLVLQAPHS